ncbi:MAG: TraB/GumN family protein, partial [Bacteroidetes bacterium]|nr:TraB/GumN family protein [Bacteroidota bacterium]
MRSTALRYLYIALIIFFPVSSLTAQQKSEKKYPALLWEITGNGLQKPSYLFGTMHVSSKLVFHLSDSFYLDIKNAEVVALELDPQLWQDEMFRFENLQTNLRYFTQGAPNDFINEKSFQLEKYDDRLKSALSNEPTVINSLLYRTYRTRADFEEDTYLDLYIYQTGKKLGKQATGVENFFQTERLIMEAAQDMLKDKRKKAPDADGESSFDLERKTQEAYRKGDLDLLDSLEKLMEPSEAYMEKFLYRRNEIQAASIDSIIKKHSLFVGVGAAHLPGKRGVIEILRRKGYTLRPVFMPDRDASRRDDIDKIKVPVSFSTFTAEDGDFSVALPGRLYRRTTNRSDESWQYADMSNGAYYMINRVKTHSGFLGQKDDAILRKVDSLLYENIPGRILKKTPIIRSGYHGFDITGRTRRGDIQRYNILITPTEVWIFKISGTNTYVEGAEADQFFNSIKLRNNTSASWTDFSPARGGFTLRWPRTPSQCKNAANIDNIPRWEYEATDSITGDAFLLWKKTVQNYRFLEEDTADLALMEESFRLSDWIEKPLSRQSGTCGGYPSLDAVFQAKDGSFFKTKFVIHGADYYLLAVHTHSKDKAFPAFFNSFAFAPYRYPRIRSYVDTFNRISVSTPIIPEVDDGVRTIIERSTSEEFLNSIPNYNNYWPRAKSALFRDDSTGEAVMVSVETFPKYYFPKDTTSFWQEGTSEKRVRRGDLLVSRKQPIFDESSHLAGYN